MVVVKESYPRSSGGGGGGGGRDKKVLHTPDENVGWLNVGIVTVRW